MSGSYRVTILYDLLDLAGGACLLLFKAKNLNFIVLIFEDLELLLVVEEIHTVTTIDFEHAYEELNALLVGCQLEHVVNRVFSDCIYCESLA